MLLLVYIVYHLLHFTTGTIQADHFMEDAMGRHDVYAVVVLGFKHPLVSAWYIIATGLLCFHLAHGIPSIIQSLGLDNPKYREPIRKLGPLLAVLIFLGLVSIPIAVMAGVVQL
jgi:succinate dehydrogenase / fumarate reductase cytochrome b subunit